MVDGRITKYLAEITLLGQPFVKDPEQTVEKLLAKKSAKVNGFTMFVVGEGIAKKTNRLVVMCSDPGDETLTKYIEEQGYETNLELLKNGKLNSLLKVVLTVLLAIGSIIILLSITGFIQYAQLLVSNAAYEIRTLLQLGYYVRVLFSKVLLFYLIVLAIIAILGVVGLFTVKRYFNEWIIDKGFEPESGVSPVVLYAGLGLMLLFLLLNAMNIYRLIRRLAG